jgi:hypothetical protein
MDRRLHSIEVACKRLAVHARIRSGRAVSPMTGDTCKPRCETEVRCYSRGPTWDFWRSSSGGLADSVRLARFHVTRSHDRRKRRRFELIDLRPAVVATPQPRVWLVRTRQTAEAGPASSFATSVGFRSSCSAAARHTHVARPLHLLDSDDSDRPRAHRVSYSSTFLIASGSAYPVAVAWLLSPAWAGSREPGRLDTRQSEGFPVRSAVLCTAIARRSPQEAPGPPEGPRRLPVVRAERTTVPSAHSTHALVTTRNCGEAHVELEPTSARRGRARERAGRGAATRALAAWSCTRTRGKAPRERASRKLGRRIAASVARRKRPVFGARPAAVALQQLSRLVDARGASW